MFINYCLISGYKVWWKSCTTVPAANPAPYLFHGPWVSSACCALNEQSICFWSGSDCEHSSQSVNSLPPHCTSPTICPIYDTTAVWLRSASATSLHHYITTTTLQAVAPHRPNGTIHNLHLLILTWCIWIKPNLIIKNDPYMRFFWVDSPLAALTLCSLFCLCNTARSVLKSICECEVSEGALAYCGMARPWIN